MDFHGKMTRYEMEGKSGPSIAQLLDQNLLSPQQQSFRASTFLRHQWS